MELMLDPGASLNLSKCKLMQLGHKSLTVPPLRDKERKMLIAFLIHFYSKQLLTSEGVIVSDWMLMLMLVLMLVLMLGLSLFDSGCRLHRGMKKKNQEFLFDILSSFIPCSFPFDSFRLRVF